MKLKLNNIKKSFDNKVIFDGFSYEFSETGIYAVVGESGAGKTTLLRIIAGLDTKYGGEVVGGGIENTAFVFQEYRLFPRLTALENAVIPNGELTDPNLVNQAKTLLSKLDITEGDMELLPNELSGGMKQRVAIVRALLRNTPVLILDEPTKELDSELRQKLYSIIREESEKRLVILVSHNGEDIAALEAEKIFI